MPEDMRREPPRASWWYDDIVELLRIVGTLHGPYELKTGAKGSEEMGKVHIAINDSDLFAWGYSGAIYITPDDLAELRRAYEDTREASKNHGASYASELFLCRKYESRPQGAMYPPSTRGCGRCSMLAAQSAK